jgi:hypothetical protein
MGVEAGRPADFAEGTASGFKKRVDFAVRLILYFIACAVVYSVRKLIYQFWT